MIDLVLSNLVRRRGRTILTASGIAVGVAMIVAILSLTAGLQLRAGELIHLGRADLGVFQRNAADVTTSVLPLDLVARLKRRPEVADATPVQLLVESIPQDRSAVVFGGDFKGFLAGRLVYSAGGPPRGPSDIVVGDRLARKARLAPGGILDVSGRPFRVVGIYHTGVFFEDSGAILPLPIVQGLAARRADEVTTIPIALKPDVSADDAVRSLSRAFPSLQFIGSADEAARVGANSALISKAIPLLVALALIVGGLAVANTMLMAILEREREIALLSAVGWSPGQLATIVMGEAVVVSIVGVALGLALGIAAGEALPRMLSLLDVVEPHVTAWGLTRACLVGLATGILGGVYPTWRVTRMAPAGVLARA